MSVPNRYSSRRPRRASQHYAPRRRQDESIATSSAWNGANQVITAAFSIVMVPLLVRRLGISAYGVYALGLTTIALLQQIDGGIISSTARYLAFYRGSGDAKRASQLVFSSLLIMISVGTAIALALSFAAGSILHFAHIPRTLRPDARFYFSVIAFLLPLGLLQALATSLLQAHARFRAVSIAGITATFCRLVAVVLLVQGAHALRTTAWVLLGYQLLSCILVIVPALYALPSKTTSLLPRSELFGVLRYAFNVQVSSVSSLVNTQVDAIILAAILPIREVGLYSTGANLASQVRALLGNFLYPTGVRLATVYGSDGSEAAFATYRKFQTDWVVINTGVFCAGIGGSIFIMEGWLGPKFYLAGIVCDILLAGYMVNMFTGMLTLYLNATGRPDVEARYGFVSMIVNVLLTVPLTFLGLLGVVGATAVGTVVGSVYLLSLARRRVRRDIPSFLSCAPWWQGLIAGGVAAAACFGLRSSVHLQGALGLVLCALGTLPALLVFVLLLPPSRRSVLRRATAGGPRATARRHSTLSEGVPSDPSRPGPG